MGQEPQISIPWSNRLRALFFALLAGGVVFNAGFALLGGGMAGWQQQPFSALTLIAFVLLAFASGALLIPISAIVGALPAILVGSLLIKWRTLSLRHFVLGGIAAATMPVAALAPIFFGLMVGLYLPVAIVAGAAGGYVAWNHLVATNQISHS